MVVGAAHGLCGGGGGGGLHADLLQPLVLQVGGTELQMTGQQVSNALCRVEWTFL